MTEESLRPAPLAGQPVRRAEDQTEGGDAFLGWLLGQQQGPAGHVPPGDDDPVRRLAVRLAGCVTAGCLDPADRFTLLDVTAHIGGHSRNARLSGWICAALRMAEQRHRDSLSVGGTGDKPGLEPTAVAPELGENHRVLAPGRDGTCAHGTLCADCAAVTSSPEFKARARAVGCGDSWPHGPSTDHQARVALVEWAERNDLRWAPDRRCLHWLAKGRCGVTECRDPVRFSFMDHVTGWLHAGKPARLVAQPYALDQLAVHDLLAASATGDLDVRVTGAGWYGAPTVFIEFRRAEAPCAREVTGGCGCERPDCGGYTCHRRDPLDCRCWRHISTSQENEREGME